MLFTSKKNNKKDSDTGDHFNGSLLMKLELASIRMQLKCAKWLERKTGHVSATSWIVILTIFVLFTIGGCIYQIINGFSGSTSSTITISPITKTRSAMKKEKQQIQNTISIHKIELEVIHHFRSYMDSLGRSPTGKKRYDSIMQERPGLLDSLAIIENHYYSQFKN